MGKSNDNMTAQLDKLSEFRKSLERYATENSKDISGMMAHYSRMYKNIRGLTQDNNRTLLMRIAADLEFLDQEEGFSRLEFERFVERIPKQLQPRLKMMRSSFDDVDKDKKGTIDFE